MSKTILIATDYSLESLNILKKVLKEKSAFFPKEKFSFLLVSGYDMGDSISDLLFRSKSSIYTKIRSGEFLEACQIIKNKYPDLIEKINCDLFTGTLQSAFNNYVKAKEISEAYFSTSLKKKNSKGKFDLSTYILNNKDLESREVVLENTAFLPERGQLAEVFVEV